VSVARWPIFSRCFSIVTPGESIGTTNAEMPRVRRRIGLREHDRPRGVAGVRDERLRAVEDVLVALARGRVRSAADVGSGSRLRERERAEDRPLDERRQPARLCSGEPKTMTGPHRGRSQ
jgi:hypothetical protein